MKRAGRIFITYLLVVSVLCGCSILPTEEEFGAAPVVKEYEGNNYNKYTITRGDMIEKESIAVTYQGTKEIEITGSDDGGQIKEICVKKGQKVKAGTVLIKEYLDETEDQLKADKRQIATLQLQIRQAKEMKARELEQLAKTGGTKEEKKNVREQYDAQIKGCQSSMQLTQLDMKEAQEEINAAVITSEMAGTVVLADNSFEGGYATSNNVLVKIQGKKKNRFSCESKYADRFQNGQEVVVTVSGVEYRTKVKKVSKKELYLYPKSSVSLGNGATGTIDLVLKEKKNVLSLPKALIYDMGGKKVVYMEGENGVKETREVTLGESIANMVEITSGLSENEQVITN